MTEWVFWIYGVVAQGDEVSPKVRDIEGGDNFTWITYRHLSALASSVPANEYSEDIMVGRTEDANWVLPRVAAAAGVIASVFEHVEIIPLKFATIFSTVEQLHARLSSQEATFRQMLEDLKGKEEWGLKVFGHVDRVIETIIGHEIAQALQRGMTPGRLYLFKKQIEQSSRKQAEDSLRKAAYTVQQFLLDHGYVGLSGRIAGEQRLRDGAIPLFKAAYLVERNTRDHFIDLVNHLQSQWEQEHLVMKISGPWAPYSFCGEMMAQSGP